MRLQRMKHAFARGARLQVQIKPDFDRGSGWSTAQECPISVEGMNLYRYNWRLRPKDAHLEYGPLSSALRELPETLEGKSTYVAAMYAAAGLLGVDSYLNLQPHTREEALMFRLFLAEALADEGL